MFILDLPPVGQIAAFDLLFINSLRCVSVGKLDIDE